MLTPVISILSPTNPMLATTLLSSIFSEAEALGSPPCPRPVPISQAPSRPGNHFSYHEISSLLCGPFVVLCPSPSVPPNISMMRSMLGVSSLAVLIVEGLERVPEKLSTLLDAVTSSHLTDISFPLWEGATNVLVAVNDPSSRASSCTERFVEDLDRTHPTLAHRMFATRFQLPFLPVVIQTIDAIRKSFLLQKQRFVNSGFHLKVHRVFPRLNVVLGVVLKGCVHVGDAVVTAAAPQVQYRVESLRLHPSNVPVESAAAGVLVGLRLPGVDHSKCASGDVLGAVGIGFPKAVHSIRLNINFLRGVGSLATEYWVLGVACSVQDAKQISETSWEATLIPRENRSLVVSWSSDFHIPLFVRSSRGAGRRYDLGIGSVIALSEIYTFHEMIARRDLEAVRSYMQANAEVLSREMLLPCGALPLDPTLVRSGSGCNALEMLARAWPLDCPTLVPAVVWKRSLTACGALAFLMCAGHTQSVQAVMDMYANGADFTKLLEELMELKVSPEALVASGVLSMIWQPVPVLRACFRGNPAVFRALQQSANLTKWTVSAKQEDRELYALVMQWDNIELFELFLPMWGKGEDVSPFSVALQVGAPTLQSYFMKNPVKFRPNAVDLANALSSRKTPPLVLEYLLDPHMLVITDAHLRSLVTSKSVPMWNRVMLRYPAGKFATTATLEQAVSWMGDGEGDAMCPLRALLGVGLQKKKDFSFGLGHRPVLQAVYIHYALVAVGRTHMLPTEIIEIIARYV